MFVVERIYENMPIQVLYMEYIAKNDIPLETKVKDLRRIIKDILKEEVNNGSRNKVTGEKVPPKPVKHTISFNAYYKNKGTKTVPKTMQVLNNLHNTSVEVKEKEIIDSRCSRYMYEITTELADEEFPTILYNNGASSVYLA